MSAQKLGSLGYSRDLLPLLKKTKQTIYHGLHSRFDDHQTSNEAIKETKQLSRDGWLKNIMHVE